MAPLHNFFRTASFPRLLPEGKVAANVATMPPLLDEARSGGGGGGGGEPTTDRDSSEIVAKRNGSGGHRRSVLCPIGRQQSSPPPVTEVVKADDGAVEVSLESNKKLHRLMKGSKANIARSTVQLSTKAHSAAKSVSKKVSKAPSMLSSSFAARRGSRSAPPSGGGASGGAEEETALRQSPPPPGEADKLRWLMEEAKSDIARSTARLSAWTSSQVSQASQPSDKDPTAATEPPATDRSGTPSGQQTTESGGRGTSEPNPPPSDVDTLSWLMEQAKVDLARTASQFSSDNMCGGSELEEDRTAESKEDRTAESKKDRTAESKKDRTAESKKDRTAESKKDRTAESKKDRTAESKKDRTAESKKDRTAKSKKDRTAELKKDRTESTESSESSGEQQPPPGAAMDGRHPSVSDPSEGGRRFRLRLRPRRLSQSA